MGFGRFLVPVKSAGRRERSRRGPPGGTLEESGSPLGYVLPLGDRRLPNGGFANQGDFLGSPGPWDGRKRILREK